MAIARRQYQAFNKGQRIRMSNKPQTDQPATIAQGIATEPLRKRHGGVVGHKGGNQYTARREQKTALENAARWQDNPRFNAGVLLTRLENAASGVAPLSAPQIKCIELMLDRVAPRLSAVEQTVIEPAARLSDAEIRAQLADLVANNAGILQELLAEHARKSALPITQASDALPVPLATQSGDTVSTQPIDNARQATG